VTGGAEGGVTMERYVGREEFVGVWWFARAGVGLVGVESTPVDELKGGENRSPKGEGFLVSSRGALIGVTWGTSSIV
jgi:hypothetical protein